MSRAAAQSRGTNRIDAAFARLKRERGKALIAYVTVGFPSIGALPRVVRLLQDEGVDLVELGVPFSDPLADGPTIQAASQRALRGGVTPDKVFRAVESLRRGGVTVPLALMTYYNPVHRHGVAAFCRDAVASGADGLIVPDLPPEEAGELVAAARPAGIDTIFLAAPTSPPERLRAIARLSTGFIYYVSLTGVTGARADLPLEVAAHVRSIKRLTRLPVCVGFGISRPEQAARVARDADGVIIGSALLNVLEKSAGNGLGDLRRFIRSMRRACRA